MARASFGDVTTPGHLVIWRNDILYIMQKEKLEKLMKETVISLPVHELYTKIYTRGKNLPLGYRIKVNYRKKSLSVCWLQTWNSDFFSLKHIGPPKKIPCRLSYQAQVHIIETVNLKEILASVLEETSNTVTLYNI